MLSYFGETRQKARARYLELVESEEDGLPPAHPLVAGEEEFVAAQLARVLASPEHPRAMLRPPRRPLAELVTSPADAGAIARAYLEHGYSMREIASHLGCGLTTVHRRLRSYEVELRGTWKT